MTSVKGTVGGARTRSSNVANRGTALRLGFKWGDLNNVYWFHDMTLYDAIKDVVR